MADERTVSAGGVESLGGAAAVGGVGEVAAPPGGCRTPEEGEGGARDEIRTAMEGVEVGGD